MFSKWPFARIHFSKTNPGSFHGEGNRSSSRAVLANACGVFAVENVFFPRREDSKSCTMVRGYYRSTIQASSQDDLAEANHTDMDALLITLTKDERPYGLDMDALVTG